MTSAWLDALNPEQRRAATHGGAGAGGPLLVIAGAGTGKTATLAHRVAHTIVSGADPNRILLLTFSRRAAAEMGRRVERIVAAALAGGRPPSLPWSGTFHAVGARLLREYAPAIGLLPDFTILDREDSADLMAIVRHDLGLSKTESRFPQKGTCLAIYSRAVNAEAPLAEVLKEAFPWCLKVETGLRDLFAAYVETKQRQAVLDYDDLLLYWAGMMEDTAIAADLVDALRSCAGRRVPGHQPPPGLDSSAPQARRARADRGRRRCPVDLFLPRRAGAEHPRLPRRLQPAGRGGDARAELPLDRCRCLPRPMP